MRSVKKAAKQLHQIATDLEKSSAGVPSTDTILRRANIKVDQTLNVSLEFLSEKRLKASFYPLECIDDMRKHLALQAGRQLGDAIAQTLDYELECMMTRPGAIMPMRDPFAYPRQRYVATVYPLTPKQLTDLIDAAFRAGLEA